MSEKCQRCGEDGEDRRTLWMACFYDMNELGIPFEQCAIEGIYLQHTGEKDSGLGFGITIPQYENKDPTQSSQRRGFYNLRVCKHCRGDWLATLKRWFDCPEKPASTSTGIFIRRHGATVELRPDEVAEAFTDRLGPTVLEEK